MIAYFFILRKDYCHLWHHGLDELGHHLSLCLSDKFPLSMFLHLHCQHMKSNVIKAKAH